MKLESMQFKRNLQRRSPFWNRWHRVCFEVCLDHVREIVGACRNVMALSYYLSCSHHKTSCSFSNPHTVLSCAALDSGSHIVISSYFAYINKANNALFSKMSSIFRLHTSWNSFNVFKKLTNHHFFLFLTLV